MKNTKLKLKFNKSLILSFDEKETKYSIYAPDTDKLLILNGAIAMYFSEYDKLELFSLENAKKELLELCPEFDAQKVEKMLVKAQNLMIENGILESSE